jgi:hypothetical protein
VSREAGGVAPAQWAAPTDCVAAETDHLDLSLDRLQGVDPSIVEPAQARFPRGTGHQESPRHGQQHDGAGNRRFGPVEALPAGRAQQLEHRTL